MQSMHIYDPPLRGDEIERGTKWGKCHITVTPSDPLYSEKLEDSSNSIRYFLISYITFPSLFITCKYHHQYSLKSS